MSPTRAEILSASPPVFTSRLLNSLIRTHPAVPLVLYGPVIVTLAVVGVQRVGVLISIALMAAGYLTWTLTEYWVHRAVFHFQPRGPRSEAFVWAIHGVHHAHPNDPRRVVTSPAASVPIGASAALLLWLLLPGALWILLAAGWGGGYLAYDLLHAYLHMGRPRTALLRRLRARHLRHHFADSPRRFRCQRAVLGLCLRHLAVRPPVAPRTRPGQIRAGEPRVRVLITTPAGLGHIHPMVPPARAMHDRRHEVMEAVPAVSIRSRAPAAASAAAGLTRLADIRTS